MQAVSHLVARIAAISVLCLIVPRSPGQPLADRLPASTLMYCGWSPSATLQTTRAARMLADRRLVDPWRTLIQKLLLSMPDDLGGGTKISEHLPQLLSEAAQCEGCFALLELAPTKGDLVPQAVLVLNLGARRANFEAHFKPIQARLKERLGERLRMMKLENSWLWMKTDRDRAAYTWGFLGDSFIFYFGDASEQFIPTLLARARKPLRDAPAFAECMAKLPGGGGDAVVTTYVDLKAGLNLVRTLIKDSNDDGVRLLAGHWHKLTVELGLDNLLCLGERTVVRDEQFLTHTLLRTTGPPRGLITSLVQPAVDDAMFKTVPADAMFVLAGRLDLSQTYDQVKSATIAVAGEDGRKAFGDFEDAAAGFGMPVNTLLGPLGDQWVIYEASSTGGFFFTGLTFVVDVRDPDRLGRTLTALRQLLAGQFQPDERPTPGSYEVDGVTIQYIDTHHSFNVFSPAWAVADKKLVIALYPQVVEDAVRQFRKEGNKSILDNPQFVTARGMVTGGAGAGAGARTPDGPLFYLSGRQFVRNLYPIALPFLSAVNQLDLIEGGGPPTAELLPSLQRLLLYVGTDAASVRVTPDGILRTKVVANPLLSPLTLTDSVPLWVAAALPSMATSRITADRTRSAANLRQIGQGILLYSSENQGKMPPDLATVIKTQDVPADTLRSPFGDKAGEADFKYFAVEALAKDIPPDIAIAYDAAELPRDDGANVLYADGHVEWLEHDGVTMALEKAEKWRAQAAAKSKP
jgi:prepilin-type processing-associated H-X9-DG protein